MKAWKSWERWAFGPVDTAPMAALRIAIGLITLGWAVSFLGDVDTFLTDTGVAPRVPTYDGGAWGVDLREPYVVMGVLVLAAITLTLGFCTRTSAVVVTLLLIAIQRRDPYVLNSGDVLVRNITFFVALMPAGEVWSIDARRRKREARPRAPWALRMLQVQVSIVYLAAVMSKLRGDTWNEGSAVGIALQLEDLQRFALPDSFTHSLLTSTAMSYGTLLLEGVLVFGLWVPALRKWVAIAGITMHVGIDLSLAVGWFSYALVAAYLAFAPAPWLRSVVARVQQRVHPSAPPSPDLVSETSPPPLRS